MKSKLQSLKPFLPMSTISALTVTFLGILSSTIASPFRFPSDSDSDSVQPSPSPSPMTTPYSNDQPDVYMEAFFDPKYHDSGIDQFLPPTSTLSESEEEEVALLKRLKVVQKGKFKRGIDYSVDFQGTGDSLAMESGHEEKAVKPKVIDSLAMESEHQEKPAATVSPSEISITTPAPSKIMIKVIQKSKRKVKKNKKHPTQSTSESQKNTQQEPVKQEQKHVAAAVSVASTFDPHLSHNSYHYDTYDDHSLVDQWKDGFNDLVYGRRKFRAYYRKPHRTPSVAQVYLEMGTRVGYW